MVSVPTYRILGANIGSHWLALATLTTTFGGAYVATRKPAGSKAEGPKINATSSDEEAFINEFLKNAEAEEKKAKH